MSLVINTFNKKTWSFAILFALTLLGLLLVFSLKTAQAVDPSERVVTIHDRSLETTILTKEKTVEAVLKQAKIKTTAYDNVDPGLTTELVGAQYHINIYHAQPVMIVDGLFKKSIMSSYETPKEIAKDAGIKLYDEDEANLSRSSDILNSDGAGLILNIDRATRFTLVLYGKVIETGTQAKNVGEMIKEKNIKLGKSDVVSLSLTSEIITGSRVEIWRNGKQTITEEVPVAFTIRQIQDPSQPISYRVVKTPGVLGKKVVTYEVVMRNGKEVARKEIQNVRTLAPQDQVEIVGSKPEFSGSFAEALARLRSCEGSYTSNTGNGYYGAYQFDIGTWGGYQGYPNAALAPPSIQDQKAWETYQRRGWRPWPSCGANLPDIYR